ncbi:MAG: CRISPR-associated endonuclease Cas2 [Phycisphaeraceae bacterium]|nr:CRISPR-associated endonuclease Cas2 [Phycisphaeraceae bacterium]
MYLSGYRCMWVVAMFDLPVDDKAARKRYARFRKALVRDGFRRMQFSVYIRDCPSRENAEVHSQRVAQAVPEDGEVRTLMITDKQFERMRVFWGKSRRPAEEPAPQLSLF